jgi:arsenate reductase
MHGVNPRAIATMKEDDIDIAGHTSNHVSEYKGIAFDFVITVCDNAKESCPVFLSTARKFHHNFPDPGKASGSEEEIMQAFRDVRNRIRQYCHEFVHNEPALRSG